MREKEGIIESSIGYDATNYTKMTTRDPVDPKIAKTKFKLLRHIDNKYSLLEVELFTGRTHQIRVHLADIGYPIIGDKIYGDPEINKEVSTRYCINRQWLHARQLIFELF